MLETHDRLFVALGIATASLLMLVGSLVAVECVGATVLYILVLHGLRRVGFERAALLSAYVYALWFYLAVERIGPAFGHGPFDATLLALDRSVLGETPSVWMQGAPGWVTDAMSVAYFAYLPYLHGIGLLELFASPERAKALSRRLFPAFALGYLGYVLIPAVGPRYAFPALYGQALSGGVLTEANARFMEAGSPGTDVFPSLHALITLIIWQHDWVYARWRAWGALPLVVALLGSTLYLRYHYAVDLLAALVVFAIANAIARWQEKQ